MTRARPPYSVSNVFGQIETKNQKSSAARLTPYLVVYNPFHLGNFLINCPKWGIIVSMQQHTASLGASGLRTFEQIADRWHLSRIEREALLGIPRSTYARLRANPERANLDRSTLERLSLVFGIYKALHVLFTDAERADTWIDRPSAAFGDRPARERLTSGLITDLAKVRQHLDVARG